MIRILLIGAFFLAGASYGQQGRPVISAPDSTYTGLLPRAIGKIDRTYEKMTASSSKKAKKALRRLQKIEDKIASKFKTGDSAYIISQYETFQKRLDGVMGNSAGQSALSGYIPSLDSIQTSLKFLKQPENIIASVHGMETTFGELTNIKEFVRQRQLQLKEQLEQLGMIKELKAFNKEVYYYQQQVTELKQLLKQPDKLAQKLVSLARSQKGFTEFFSSNSILSRLFPMPSGYGTAQALQGLQARTNVQSQISQQLGMAANTDPQQFFTQQLSRAQSELNALKNKINELGGNNSDMIIPDFKPNTQRTKTFWQRIEYGLNIQSQRPNGLLPVTSDIAFTAGYKFTDNIVSGIGGGVKVGWGKDIGHLKISGQGVSLRSYIDMKIKSDFWITGGYEYNYLDEFKKIDALKDITAWQNSGLIGVTKKYSIGKRKGSLQLLWDFLSYKQVPHAQPLKFRIGYVF